MDRSAEFHTKILNTRKRLPFGILVAALLLVDPCVDALHDWSLQRTDRNKVAFHQTAWAKGASQDSERVGTRSYEDTKAFLIKKTAPRVPLYTQERVPTVDDRASTQYTRGQHIEPKIIIIGGPASGKGTQCEIIARRYGIVHLSTGDMLREASKTGSDVGRIATDYMDRGELVPDDIIMRIVEDRLQQQDCRSRGWLLDGFPRTRNQAENLRRMDIEADLVIFLDVPDEVLIDRVLGRRLEPETGKIHHLKNRPPPAETLGRLQQRSDDTLESILRRLHNFHCQVADVRAAIGMPLVQVDGNDTTEAVAARISETIVHTIKRKQLKA